MCIIIVEQNQHTRKGKLTHVCVCDYEKPVCEKTITINETKEKFFYCRGLIRVGGTEICCKKCSKILHRVQIPQINSRFYPITTSDSVASYCQTWFVNFIIIRIGSIG